MLVRGVTWFWVFMIFLFWLSFQVKAEPKRTRVMSRSGLASYHSFGKPRSCAVLGARRGDVVRVRGNGRSVVCTVRGSGPYVRGRVIDLSPDAFSYLYGGLGRGVAPCSYTIIKRGKGAWAGRVR